MMKKMLFVIAAIFFATICHLAIAAEADSGKMHVRIDPQFTIVNNLDADYSMYYITYADNPTCEEIASGKDTQIEFHKLNLHTNQDILICKSKKRIAVFSLFVSNDRKYLYVGGDELFKVDIATGEIKAITDFESTDPENHEIVSTIITVTETGKIFFVRLKKVPDPEWGQTTNSFVYSINEDGTGLKEIVNLGLGGNISYFYNIGNFIYYLNSGWNKIYQYNLFADQNELILDWKITSYIKSFTLSCSSDGKKMIFEDSQKNWYTYIVETKQLTQLPKELEIADIGGALLFSSGNKIAFCKNNRDLYMCDTDGKNVQRLIDIESPKSYSHFPPKIIFANEKFLAGRVWSWGENDMLIERKYFVFDLEHKQIMYVPRFLFKVAFIKNQ